MKKSVKGFCIEVKIPGIQADICHATVGKSVGNLLSMNNLQVVRDWGFFRLDSTLNFAFDLVCLNYLVTKVFSF
jgi:hypothetical protein